MTILEKQSLRKKKSIIYLVENGEYSAGYALLKVEDLYDAGKLTDADYEELAEYLEEKLDAEMAAQDAQAEVETEEPAANEEEEDLIEE